MTDPPHPDWSARLATLRRRWQDQRCDACVINSLTNIFYLCGVRASAGLLVQSHDASDLLLDGRYTTAVLADRATGRAGPVTVQRVDGS